MKIIIETEVENCGDCPYFKYVDDNFGEPVYRCNKNHIYVEKEGINHNCIFIESTIEKLRNNK